MMKYISGESVELYDIVENNEGETWIQATVVYIADTNEATKECQWLLDEKPEWAEGSIAICWNFLQEPENISDRLLFTDTENNDELRFVRRQN
ncbi:hypothetical protein [Microbulbifer sp. GL-2]|uniref:hypothetical protein n=1 Tax=Microbulbifer sp. GL-2 TaxID=2591606 RepID=UPI0011638E96|nr:hypothetical protein [Microbulbifer sp. GL-2]BBM00256.1 hypothetical protein GL2_03300 [Microbulbifer sp. GL-2]